MQQVAAETNRVPETLCLRGFPGSAAEGGAGPLDVLPVSLSYAASPTRDSHPPGSQCGGPSKAGSTQRPPPQKDSPEPHPVCWKIGPSPATAPFVSKGTDPGLRVPGSVPSLLAISNDISNEASVTYRGAPSLSSIHTAAMVLSPNPSLPEGPILNIWDHSCPPLPTAFAYAGPKTGDVQRHLQAPTLP